MNDAQAAADINTEYRTVHYPVSLAELELAIRESLKWSQYQERAELQTVPGTYDNPSMKEFMDIFFTTTSVQGGQIDTQSPYMSGLINRMEAEGSMGAVAAQELRDYGNQVVSRGTELEIGTVTEGDVQYARTL
ncbi:MAG: hypothetical protein QNJ71_11270 [Acidimicrobiia bacterium]|nr:hypothetical protein [Acidimicrobiia bacterium]